MMQTVFVITPNDILGAAIIGLFLIALFLIFVVEPIMDHISFKRAEKRKAKR